ncbi:MAG: dienelactone hydrolase family protein [Phycisphaerae bacterium]|nr:dienelactone hydrolase family protein [Phycisphaerae bacterium]
MLVRTDEPIEIGTPTGPMRAHVFRPAADGRFPGIALFSEIFQITGPIRRLATSLAGHGYLVAAPEIFHEFEPPGCVLPYDEAGVARGNAHKKSKELGAIDADARGTLDLLKSMACCSGSLGSIGFCVGGHLSLRAAMEPDVLAAASFYATDVHSRTLGRGGDDSLDRLGEITGELLLVWGRQDPHVPREARERIARALGDAGANYQWIELNQQHAFMRDEGHRHDPAAAAICWALTLDLFRRRLRGTTADPTR